MGLLLQQIRTIRKSSASQLTLQILTFRKWLIQKYRSCDNKNKVMLFPCMYNHRQHSPSTITLLGANLSCLPHEIPPGLGRDSYPPLYLVPFPRLHWQRSIKTLCIALSAERRKLMREGRSWGINICNELLFHSVGLGGYVCLPTCSSEASSFGSARKWRKRKILVGLQ